MVFQRNQPIRLFGHSLPAAHLSAEFAGTRGKARASSAGKWQITLPAQPAGGPFSLTLKADRETIVLSDILVGDVWFCAGQSNMEMQLRNCKRPEADIRNAHHPLVRYFKAERTIAATPQDTVPGAWQVCGPATAPNFSGVAFYFGREIQRKTGIPIGLIDSTWGGTPIEAWLPPSFFTDTPEFHPLLATQAELDHPSPALFARLAQKHREWTSEHISIDPGIATEARTWAQPGLDDRKWKIMSVPGAWEKKGLLIDGSVWFRRRVKIPTQWRGHRLQLELGSLDDFDVTYFNGTEIGSTGKSVENAYRVPRIYSIPPELTQSASALLAVRIFDQYGSGGFTGTPESLRLSCPDFPNDRASSLAGKWRYKVEWAVDRRCPSPAAPALPEPRAQLSRLYNGMVRPFHPVPIRGFLWYQGETNTSRAAHYGELFPRLITAWRKLWQAPGLLPFYFVQLAGFRARTHEIAEDAWAELREAQGAALSLDHVGMATAIDLGDANDVHPKNKREVGRRLARLALAHTYGSPIIASGPQLREARMEGNQARLIFNHTSKGLRTSDGKSPRGFLIAGANRQWHWAQACIEGKETVLLTCAEVPSPVAVRYAWAGNPDCNLVNSAKLPAPPFRTDCWPGITDGETWPF